MHANMLLAILAQLDLISKERAAELAKRINDSIAPARYAEAERVVAEIFDSVK